MNYGVKNIIGCDRTGAIYRGRSENTNPTQEKGPLADVIEGADVFVWHSDYPD